MIAAGMLYTLVISVLFTLAAHAAERLLGLSRRPRRFIWLLVMVASALVPCINIIASARAQPPSGILELSNTEPSTTQASRAPERIRLPLFHPAHPVWPILPYWDSPLTALWALSSTAILLGMIATSLRFRRISNHWPVVQINGRPIKLTERTGPALFGILRPQVILPRWLLDTPPDIRSIVIAHEESHLVAYDPLLLRIAQLIVALTPWNLPAWWQLRRLRFAIEVDCDARILTTNIDPTSYGEALLAIAQHRSRSPLGAIAATQSLSQLERRIQVMLSTTPRYYPTLAGALAALAVTFVASATQVQVPVATSTVESAAVAQELAPDGTSDNPTDDTSAKPDRRLTVEADQAFSNTGKSVVFSGHVKVRTKRFVILAGEATRDAAHPRLLTVRGTPATFTLTPSPGAAVVRGAAESMAFDGVAHEVRLTGHASLTQGEGATLKVVKAEQITYPYP